MESQESMRGQGAQRTAGGAGCWGTWAGAWTKPFTERIHLSIHTVTYPSPAVAPAGPSPMKFTVSGLGLEEETWVAAEVSRRRELGRGVPAEGAASGNIGGRPG